MYAPPQRLWATKKPKVDFYADKIIDEVCDRLIDDVKEFFDVDELQKLLDDYSERQLDGAWIPDYSRFVTISDGVDYEEDTSLETY